MPNNNLQTAYDFFVSQGASPAAAAGIASGLYAESGLNPGISNPAGGNLGAYGIGQFRGAFQTDLFSETGTNTPSLLQQLQYVWDQLTQGSVFEPASVGQTILNDTSPNQALSDFITKFERPAPGYETTSDISRGTNALGQINMNTGSTGLQLPTWAGNLLAPFQDPFGLFGTSTLVSPNNAVGTGVGVAQTGQAVQQATGDIAGAVAAGVGAGVKPLSDWLSGLTSGATVTRVTVGIVAVILLLAGIFFLANNKQITLNMPSRMAGA